MDAMGSKVAAPPKKVQKSTAAGYRPACTTYWIGHGVGLGVGALLATVTAACQGQPSKPQGSEASGTAASKTAASGIVATGSAAANGRASANTPRDPAQRRRLARQLAQDASEADRATLVQLLRDED